MTERVPFGLAIADDNLLGRAWKALSLPQQVALKSLYGLPLTDPAELRIWSAQQGPQWTKDDGVYDDLGFLVGEPPAIPYVPKEHDTFTGVIGRRSGKSIILTGFIGAYEIGLGGHMRFAKTGVPTMFAYIAQDKALAQANMQGIVQMMLSSPLLKTLVPDVIGQEQIKFTNGITLTAMANNIKSSRGYAIMGVVFDELGFWYKDADSAAPDYEVERAIESAMDQFQGLAKSIRITTPWTKEGMAYDAMVAGTEGRRLPRGEDNDEQRDMMTDHLVVYAPTAAMGNPLITRKRLARKKKRDPIGFARENLALFIDAQAGYLNHGRIAEAVDRGKSLQILPSIDIQYVAVMDPAFRNDDYTLTVLHKDKHHGIVQDYVFGWSPEPGERLNPSDILDEVKQVLDTYNLNTMYSDQHQLEALQELAHDRDFTIIGFDFTKTSKPKVMQSLNLKLNQNKLVLQNHPTQTMQLRDLQRTNLDGGGQKIAAPPGKKDDFATVLALGVYFADMLPEAESAVKNVESSRKGRDKSVIMREEAQRIYDQLYASGDPQALEILDRSDFLRALVEESNESHFELG